MFDWPVFLLIAAAAVTSVVIGIPRQVRAWLAFHQRLGTQLPRASLLTAGSVIQAAFLAVAGAAAGTALAPRLGLSAGFLEAFARGDVPLRALGREVLSGLTGGVIAAAILPVYYRYFRKRVDPHALATERVRVEMGLLARTLMGGVYEETVFRWGAVSLFAWIVAVPFGAADGVALAIGIIAAGTVFGLGHLPGARSLGIRITPTILGMALTLNLWVGMVCGVLLWRWGLAAAMIAHASIHVIWHPLDMRAARALPDPAVVSNGMG